MTANLSFLPMSAAKATLDTLGPEGLPAQESRAGNETTVYRLTSDPRYVLRIHQARLEDGRRTRSTCILDRKTGVVLDRLDLISEDGRRWRLRAAR